MKLLRHAVVVLAILAAATCGGTGAEAASAKVVFVLVSDIYQMGEAKQPDGTARGGFARLAAVVNAERAKGGNVVVVHAGDTLSPSLMSGSDKGAHIIQLTNMIAPDVFVPGNHEFDFGKAVFLERMREATFPLFAANLRGPDGKPLPGFKDRALLTIDGVRIGITSATYDETPRVSSTEDLRFLPISETMKSEAEALRREGADFVVAVVHASRGQDYALNALGVLDLILSGHDHDLFVNYDERSAIVESTSDARHVAIVEATVNVKETDGKRQTTWAPVFRLVDTALVTPDPVVAARVKLYEDQLARELDEPIGTTTSELDSRNTIVRATEAAIGNLFADALRASTKADIALINGGGFRGGRFYKAGTRLTKRDVLAELPFNNRVVTLQITGRELRRAIEHGLSGLPAVTGRFLHISGMAVEARLAEPAGRRVTLITVAGFPLADEKLYVVATNDFLARGGDAYSMLRDATHLLKADDSPLIANAVIDFIRASGTISPKVEGRIRIR